MSFRLDDESAVRKHLKVFVGTLPDHTPEHAIGSYFSKYGHILNCSLLAPKDDKAPSYAFVTFKYAAEADAAVVDLQHTFPGSSRPLSMGFATPKNKKAEDRSKGDGDPCKVLVEGITMHDSEEELGDFFSQWGLVAMVYRDSSPWSSIHYATKEGASRLLEEGSIIFRRRRLDMKAADTNRTMDEGERGELIRRAVARHFHKKSQQMTMPPAYPGQPPPHGYPPHGYYGHPPPHGGYYGAPPPHGYYGAPPPGYPPHAPPGYPGYPPPGSYPPHSAYYGSSPHAAYGGAPPQTPPALPSSAPPGAPPPGAPDMSAYYGASPVPSAAPYGAPPAPSSAHGYAPY